MRYGVLKDKDFGERIGEIVPLTYARARLCVGKKDEWSYEDAW